MGGTSTWRVCGLNPSTSLAVVFEVANQVCGGVATFQRSSVVTAQGSRLHDYVLCVVSTASQCHPARAAWRRPVHHVLPALLGTEEGAGHYSGQTVSWGERGGERGEGGVGREKGEGWRRGGKGLIICVVLSRWADAATNLTHIAASFDQECAAVVMARMAVAK